jgi:apolipoprotein D and lipocalin family protein
MKKTKWLLLGVFLASIAVNARSANPPAELKTVPHLDLSRYLGRWYEIARYPNWFEKQCARDVTATYELRKDGRISVSNACVKEDGKRRESTGWAKIADPASNAKLKVTFFWPFFGDYWVLELGPNYEYAVIGEPSRKYLWILSRTPQMSDEQYRSITGNLSARGYDANRLVRVKQANNLAAPSFR